MSIEDGINHVLKNQIIYIEEIINTSITIVFGFSILVLSNFIPTIYFGVFTGIAMLLAMISVLTLLPSLIIISKPFEYLKN